jgi:hypothetical protein
MQPYLAPSALENARFCWLVRRVHGLGPRVFAEFLAEIGAEHLIRTAIDRMLERYTRLDPEVLRTAGGDRFPPLPIHLVGKDQP